VPESEARLLEELLPSPDAGPEAAYALPACCSTSSMRRSTSCRKSSGAVFIAHELEGRSFQGVWPPKAA